MSLVRLPCGVATVILSSMTDERARGTGLYRFPLRQDPPGVVTLLAVDADDPRAVRLHLFSAEKEAGDGEGVDSPPRLHVPPSPRQTLTLPARSHPGLTPPEEVLSRVGVFLRESAFGDPGEVYPWYLEELLDNDQLVAHLTVLAHLHARLERARTSPVSDDPRVREQIRLTAATGKPHSYALLDWLQLGRGVSPRARAMALEEVHERRVARVLAELRGGMEESTDERPNPGLPRLTPDAAAPRPERAGPTS